MTDEERSALVEQAAAAWRPTAIDGTIRSHPAWYDLDDAGRREAFALATVTRTLEAALDPDGLSTTAKAVLAKIRGD
ncbi:MAG TPA: hypothetical protein VG755_11160 [Nannocystaceae bacterium]|nr:hypothetical protein [Nannocystaceae bacterium]